MTDVENPNEYDDEMFTTEANRLDSAIGGLWEAGASIENIEDTITNALANAGVPKGTLLSVEVE